MGRCRMPFPRAHFIMNVSLVAGCIRIPVWHLKSTTLRTVLEQAILDQDVHLMLPHIAVVSRQDQAIPRH